MQSLKLTASFTAAAAVLLLLLLMAPLVSAASCNWDWFLYKDSCYAYFNQSSFWYDGEMTCKEQGGHLVSIADDHENRLVGKVSLCRNVWIGRYARDLSRLDEPGGYAWTDDSVVSGSFSRHNFSGESSIHKPLVRSQGLNWYNALYHEQHPFVCKSPVESSDFKDKTTDCPSRTKFFQGHCYLFSGFEANFIEANFYCQNHSTNLVSILSEPELRFLNTLDLSTDACDIQSVWLGLVKLSPCNPDGGGRELCYQWTDFSGKYLNFPRWAEDHPTTQSNAEQSCVTLSGDYLVGAACNERRAFVCKAAAGSLTGDAWKALDVSPILETVVPGNEHQQNDSLLVKTAASSTGEGVPELSTNASEAIKKPTDEISFKEHTANVSFKNLPDTLPMLQAGEATIENQDTEEPKEIKEEPTPTVEPPKDFSAGSLSNGPDMKPAMTGQNEPTSSSNKTAVTTAADGAKGAHAQSPSKDVEERFPSYLEDIANKLMQGNS